jgi:hypothetical protein
VVSFIFTWIAHLNGSVGDPHWIALQTGKTFEVQNLWPVYEADNFEWYFIIPGSGYGRIYAKNCKELLKPDQVSGLTC